MRELTEAQREMDFVTQLKLSMRAGSQSDKVRAEVREIETYRTVIGLPQDPCYIEVRGEAA